MRLFCVTDIHAIILSSRSGLTNRSNDIFTNTI